MVKHSSKLKSSEKYEDKKTPANEKIAAMFHATLAYRPGKQVIWFEFGSGENRVALLWVSD